LVRSSYLKPHFRLPSAWMLKASDYRDGKLNCVHAAPTGV